MSDQINKLLKKLSNNLSKSSLFGQSALNYSVSVKIFYDNTESELNEIDLIESVLAPKAVVGNIEKCDLSELLDIVKKCFEYAGDEVSYPNRRYYLSEEFKVDLNQALEQIKVLFSNNLGIFEFWLEDGHPFYPVFWDFAFLVKKRENNFILIGSSSD